MLDPRVSPEEIKSREVVLGLRVGLLSLQLFPNGGHCLCDCSAPQLGQEFRGAVIAAQCRADTALTSCCSGGGPRQPWSSGLAPVASFTLLSPFSHSQQSQSYSLPFEVGELTLRQTLTA